MTLKIKLTSNRKLILLNFVLLILLTLLSGVVFGGMSSFAIGGIVSSVLLRVVFGHKNPRPFKGSKTITTSNGKTLTKKHQYLCIIVATLALVVGWFIGTSFNWYDDFIFVPITLFFFQIIVKSLYFALDIPIGTFDINDGHNPDNLHFPSAHNLVYSPVYKGSSCNIYRSH